jgi:hypothetical protein
MPQANHSLSNFLLFTTGQYAHNTQIIDLTGNGGGAQKFHALGEDNSTIGILFY